MALGLMGAFWDCIPLGNIEKSVSDLTVPEFLSLLSPPPTPDTPKQPKLPPRRPNLQREEVRHKYFEEERLKAHQTAQKVRLRRKMQMERDQKRKEYVDALKEFEEYERAEQELALEDQKLRFRDAYLQELEKMQQRKSERRQQIEKLKEVELASKEKAKGTPLYKKMEEKHLLKSTMPNLQQHKERLKKVRMLQSPGPQHFRHQSDTKNSYSSPLGAFLIQKEKQQALEEEQKSRILRLQLLEKKKQYSNAVKELYSPTIDRFKQKELELRKEKLLHPIRRDPFKRSTDSMNQSAGDLLGTPDMKSEWKPRKYAPNPMIPQPSPKKTPKQVDYLAEMRRHRHHEPVHDIKEVLETEITRPSNLKRIKQYTNQIEQKIRFKESQLAMGSPANLKALEVTEDVDDLLVTAIKAKIAALDNFS